MRMHTYVCVYIYIYTCIHTYTYMCVCVAGHTDSAFPSNDNCVRYCITARSFRAPL